MSLSGALCVGQGPLFESTHAADHAEASRVCGAGTVRQCPAFAACDTMARSLQRGPVDSRPVGTWAATLYGTDAAPREHASERGWRQHKRYREKACADCRSAHLRWSAARVGALSK